MRLMFFPVVLFIAACAQTPPAPAPVTAAVAPANPASGAVVVAQQSCHRENKAGTNMFQMVCDQTDLERQKGLDGISRLTGPQAAAPSAFH